MRPKDVARVIKNAQRPTAPTNTMGVASSISKDGDTVNGQDYSDGEVRDLLFALPYGISSSGLDGIRIQIIRNDNENNVAVGVIDKKRPKVKSGCLILYDKAGSTIKLNGDGSIGISNKSGSAIKLNSNGSIDINADIVRVNGKQLKMDE